MTFLSCVLSSFNYIDVIVLKSKVRQVLFMEVLQSVYVAPDEC